jgi:hypothetical protein
MLKTTQEISSLDIQIRDNFTKIVNLRKERSEIENKKESLEKSRIGYNNLPEFKRIRENVVK